MSTHEEDFDVMMVEVELLIENFKKTGRINKAGQLTPVYSRLGPCDEKLSKTASFEGREDMKMTKETGKSFNEISKVETCA